MLHAVTPQSLGLIQQFVRPFQEFFNGLAGVLHHAAADSGLEVVALPSAGSDVLPNAVSDQDAFAKIRIRQNQ